MKRNLKNLVMDARQISAVCGRAKTAGKKQQQSKGEAEPWQAKLGTLKAEEEPEVERPKLGIGKGTSRKINCVLRKLLGPETRRCTCRGKDGTLKNSYASWAEAHRVAKEREAIERTHFNIYECPEIRGTWHLTSNQEQW